MEENPKQIIVSINHQIQLSIFLELFYSTKITAFVFFFYAW